MSFLAAFPQPISVELLCNYCDSVDLQKFDVAVCNNKERPILLDALQSAGFVMVSPSHGHQLQWISARRIKARNYELESDEIHQL